MSEGIALRRLVVALLAVSALAGAGLGLRQLFSPIGPSPELRAVETLPIVTIRPMGTQLLSYQATENTTDHNARRERIVEVVHVVDTGASIDDAVEELLGTVSDSPWNVEEYQCGTNRCWSGNNFPRFSIPAAIFQVWVRVDDPRQTITVEAELWNAPPVFDEFVDSEDDAPSS